MRIALLTQAHSALVDTICSIVPPRQLTVVDFSKDGFCPGNGVRHIRFDNWEHLAGELAGNDLVISYRLNKIIPMELLSRLRYGGLNVHPSMLPKYPGANPWFQMYCNMETEGGVTVHRITETPDAGNIIVQRPFRIEPGEPLPSAMKKADKIACDLIKEVIDGELYLLSGIRQTAVSHDNIALESLRELPAQRLWHILRGFPSLISTLYPSLPHKYFEVGEFIVGEVGDSEAGTIRTTGKGRWIVCSDGLISLFDFMQIPMTADYLEAVETSDIADFERNPDGSLKFIQGREAIVFPAMKGDTKVAVRFLRNLTSSQVADYRRRLDGVGRLFRQHNLTHFPDFEIIANAVDLSKGSFPAIVMKWASGLTLIEFLKRNIRNTQQLLDLLQNFIDACLRNHAAGIVHGDIHSANIIVDDSGRFTIIDIDNAWHPDFGPATDSGGNCNYQHPGRRLNKVLGPHIDRFSEIIVCTTIYVAIHAPELFTKYCGNDSLFVEKDYTDSDRSPLIAELAQLPQTAPLAALITDSCRERKLENIPSLETIRNLYENS